MKYRIYLGNGRLGKLGEGSMFGEMALIDDQPRMASARAIDGPLVVFVITRELFNAKLDDANLFIGKLLSILAENVRSSSEMVK
jgi:CRP-like cAMP-binding protein